MFTLDNTIDKSKLNKHRSQRSKPFIILGNLKGNNSLWRSKEKNEKAENSKKS